MDEAGASNLPDRPDIFRRRADLILFLLADLHRGSTKDRFLHDLHSVRIDTVHSFTGNHSAIRFGTGIAYNL